MLSSHRRLRLEFILAKLEHRENVTIEERIELHKYASRFPPIATKLRLAMERADI